MRRYRSMAAAKRAVVIVAEQLVRECPEGASAYIVKAVTVERLRKALTEAAESLQRGRKVRR